MLIYISSEIRLGFYLFALFTFLRYPLYTFFQALFQLAGDFYIKRLKHIRMPTKNTYTQKTEYILPFKGKWTVRGGGMDKRLRHRGSVSQTYAYDFVIMDGYGKSCQGNSTDLHNYFCYAKDIIATADGIVVQVRKNAKDSLVDGVKAYCGSSDIRGNYITIKHNDGEYSVSAHLMPGSIVVEAGDKVKQGMVIAKCGNSGNSSEPHLHFQFQSGKSFFFSAGLPLAFKGITAQNKTNYKMADRRSTENNLQIAGDKVYIGRGLEVYNEI